MRTSALTFFTALILMLPAPCMAAGAEATQNNKITPQPLDYMDSVNRYLMRNWHFWSTESANWASVDFQIDKDGNILEPKIIHSSNSKDLDQRALECVRNASPLPLLPPLTSQPTMHIQMGFRTVSNADRAKGESYYARAVAELERNQAQKAIEYLQIITQFDPGNEKAGRDLVAECLKQAAQAKSDVQALSYICLVRAEDEDNQFAKQKYDDLMKRLGKNNQSIEDLLSLVNEKDMHRRASCFLLRQARSLATTEDQWQKLQKQLLDTRNTASCYEQIMTYQDDLAIKKTADAYLALGTNYSLIGDRKNAMENYEKALECDPKCGMARTFLEMLKAKPAN